jgi:hypothetical protein
MDQLRPLSEFFGQFSNKNTICVFAQIQPRDVWMSQYEKDQKNHKPILSIQELMKEKSSSEVLID